MNKIKPNIYEKYCTCEGCDRVYDRSKGLTLSYGDLIGLPTLSRGYIDKVIGRCDKCQSD